MPWLVVIGAPVSHCAIGRCECAAVWTALRICRRCIHHEGEQSVLIVDDGAIDGGCSSDMSDGLFSVEVL